jgi:hypothetical protein
MVAVRWGYFPQVAGDDSARRWLQSTANIGRARNTVDAYGRAVDDHLRFCRAVGADPLTSKPDVSLLGLAIYARDPTRAR